MTNTKFKVEKFTGKNNFSLWKLKVQDLLVQLGLHKTLHCVKNNLDGMTNLDSEDFNAGSLSTITLCFMD